MRNSAVLSLAAIATGVIFLHAGGDHTVYASSTRVAFTATALSKTLDRSGTEALVTTKTVAVRSDGSRSVTRRDFDPRRANSAGETREIHDVTGRQHIEIHPAVRAKITFQMDDAAAARLIVTTAPNCGAHGKNDVPVHPSILGFLS